MFCAELLAESSGQEKNMGKSSCASLAKMFPALAAMWIFHFLEWTESLLVARLNLATRGLLEPVLLEMTETAVRHATGVRGHREAWVSRHFPGFNIVRLWRLTGGYLKEILEDRHRFTNQRGRARTSLTIICSLLKLAQVTTPRSPDLN